MKRLIIMLVLLIAILSGCANKPDSPSEIIVMSGSTVIDTIVGKNKWNDSVIDRQDNFIALMENKEKTDLPYINLGEDISIAFTGDIPDSVILKDYILNSNGETKYSENEVLEIPLQFSDETVIFMLKENLAAFLSSDSADYEQGGIIRGFKLTCSWGDNECEYAFILRTDAE